MASTVIGAGITIEGEVTSDEDVVVQGTLRGKLVAKDAVTIEHGGEASEEQAGLDGDHDGQRHLRHHEGSAQPGARA